MDRTELARLLKEQDGVVSRRQLLGIGAKRHDVQRLLRRKELVLVHDGVYVDHTGEPTRRQLAWAAVLFAAPAALCLESALDVEHDPVHVAIDTRRRVRPPDGVRVHRVARLHERVRWSARPPRLRVEDTVLELVDRAETETGVVRLLAEAVNKRITTADRLRQQVAARPRLRRRRWVLEVLDDVESGTSSVLEHAYLVRVERAHDLPTGTRQAVRRTSSGREYRDVEYEPYGVVVELDGRAAHESWTAGDRDADRDLDDAAAGRETIRLRHRQVLETGCRTATRVGAVLQRRGWVGELRGCGPDCPVGVTPAAA